jgi:transcriptional regulator with XRE-family HTH domain
MINCFAEHLKDLLRIKGFSQKRLAENLNVQSSTVNQWVNGKREPEFDVLLKICVFLDVEPNELLGYKKAKNKILQENN